MPIIIRGDDKTSTSDLIKRFKKATIMADIVDIAKERRYYQKPSRLKAVHLTEMRRLRKRARSLKRRKNVSPQALVRINERLSSR